MREGLQVRPLALDLFSGTGSLTKRALAAGYEVHSFDILELPLEDPRLFHHRGDIRTADIPRGADFAWASPPCEGFSVAAIGKSWTAELPRRPKSDSARIGLDLLRYTIRTIAEKEPLWWVIENPRGMMRKIIDDVFVDNGIIDYKRETVSYCQYGDDRMKPTDLWTNIHGWAPRPICKNGAPCHVAAPRGSKTGTQGRGSYLERSKIPPALLDEILQAAARSQR
jgi:hypothetical protein